MSNYTILTDSGCDIAPALLEQWGVGCIDLSFRFQDEKEEHNNWDVPSRQFYEAMRQGKIAQTSAINQDGFIRFFEQELKKGNDILYVGFASGLSSTLNNAMMAAAELRERYPQRTVCVTDSCSGSVGQGLVLYYAVKRKGCGAGLAENAACVRENSGKICSWFTVEDLVYLKRGGRINPRTAFVASVLNIKPIIHMDDEGHLTGVAKVRGRKAAIRALAERYGDLAENPEQGLYYISHGDCPEDAAQLDAAIYEKFGNRAALTADIGPVIGAHSGPGTLALFFIGKQR